MSEIDFKAYALDIHKNHPESLAFVFKTAIILDPQLKFIESFDMELYIIYLNAVEQKYFNQIFSRNKIFNLEAAKLLNINKIESWFNNRSYKVGWRHHFLIRVLVESGANVYDENTSPDKTILKVFLDGGYPKLGSFASCDDLDVAEIEWSETFKTILMYAKKLPKMDFFKRYDFTHIGIVLAEFYANKCEILELESDTKNVLSQN
jgi:hypothetical protein